MYLFSRLAWNSEESVDQIARDWIALYFGEKNVEPLKKALFLSYDLWKTTYLNSDPISQLVFKWTMVFQPNQEVMSKVLDAIPIELLKRSNDQALALASEIRTLIYSIDVSKAPDPTAVHDFRRAADLTLLYFQMFNRWRELLWQAHDLDRGSTSQIDKTTVLRLCNELEALLPDWRRYPQEAKDWLIFRFDPDLNTAPEWMKRTSVADTVRDIRNRVIGAKRDAPSTAHDKSQSRG